MSGSYWGVYIALMVLWCQTFIYLLRGNVPALALMCMIIRCMVGAGYCQYTYFGMGFVSVLACRYSLLLERSELDGLTPQQPSHTTEG